MKGASGSSRGRLTPKGTKLECWWGPESWSCWKVPSVPHHWEGRGDEAGWRPSQGNVSMGDFQAEDRGGGRQDSAACHGATTGPEKSSSQVKRLRTCLLPFTTTMQWRGWSLSQPPHYAAERTNKVILLRNVKILILSIIQVLACASLYVLQTKLKLISYENCDSLNCPHQVAETVGENQWAFLERKTEITLGMKFVSYN